MQLNFTLFLPKQKKKNNNSYNIQRRNKISYYASFVI